MPSENVIESDVLVIGGGIAGLLAAIKAREAGVNVILVEKGYTGRTGASLFVGGFSLFNPEWGHKLDEWMAQIAQTGDYLNNPEWTEITLKSSYDIYRALQSWGVPFADRGDQPPHRRGVLEAIGYGPGRIILPLMRKQAEKSGVKVMDRIMVTDLIKQDGRITGAVGFHTGSGDFYIFQAKVIVMCTGGGGLGGFDPIESRLGAYDGEGMAYRVGAEISGKEFSLTGVGPFSYMGTGYGYYGDRKDDTKVSLKGKKIRPVPVGYHPNAIDKYVDAEGNKVNRYSAVSAVHSGRGPILLNIDDATPEEISSVLREIKHWVADTAQESEIDLIKGTLYSGAARFETYLGHPIEGAGAGLWSADTKGSTSLPGLYAAGDCYNSRAVGAKYPGGGMGSRNAAVIGAIAGRSAAEYAAKAGKIAIDRGELAKLKSNVYVPMERPGGFDADWVAVQLKSIMIPYYIWMIRHGDRLKAALTLVEFLNNHVAPRMYARPRNGHGLRIVHEVKGRILSVEMMLRSALFRTESRGVHYREDYPRRDDKKWLALVKIKEREGKMELVKEPLPKKWWPDLSIPYGERYPLEFLGEESVRRSAGSKPV
jgi:succinate dehydrogenase/fumarate reductase flavoprotein subunit